MVGRFARSIVGVAIQACALLEALRLRAQDLDFAMKQITARDGKGFKDRFAVLPQSAIPVLREHLAQVRMAHEEDLRAGFGVVYLSTLRSGAQDRTRPGNGVGNTCSLRGTARLISGPEFAAVITWMNPRSARRLKSL